MTASRLHCRIEGSGPPVIILHGLFGTGQNWSGISRRLANSFQTYRVDLRNHGASGHADTMSFTEMAEDVLALMQDQGLEQAALIGHSLGGKVAMTLALEYPDWVSKLAVLDIAPVTYDNHLDRLVKAMMQLPLELVDNRRTAGQLLQAAIPDDTLRRFLLQNLQHQDGTWSWRINLPAIANHLSGISAFHLNHPGRAYQGPCLFLGGTESDYLLPDYHKEINRLFPQAVIKMIEGAGHWLHADQPEAVTDALLTFL